ncbi:MAG: PilW family protein, partial [Deferrisomatales bacterium]
MRHHPRRAFTLVELLVTLAVSAITLTLVYQIFVAQRRGYTVAEDVAEMQQNARIAADEVARLLKSVGNGVAREAAPPQRQLLYCGPYEVVFNSDLDPAAGPADANTAIPSLFAAGTLATTPAAAFAGGAETYQLGLRADGPRQFALIRRTYTGGAAQEAEVALNLSVTDEAGADVPLYRYFGDFDGDGSTDPWPTPLAPVTDLSGKGRALDQMVR